MRHQNLIALLVLACGLLAYGSATAEVAPDSTEALSVIRFNISPGGYPPYTQVHDDGRVSGIMWDVMQALANAHNLQLEVSQIPTKRVNDFLLTGQLDATMRAKEWTPDPERFVFTEGVLEAHDVVFSSTRNPLNASEIDDLRGKTLLANLGYHHPVLESLFASGAIKRIDVPDTLAQLTRLVNANHFDGAIANRRAAQWLIHQNGWDDHFRVESVALDVTQYRLMFAPQWAPMMEQFNVTLASMRDSGELNRIIALYLPNESRP